MLRDLLVSMTKIWGQIHFRKHAGGGVGWTKRPLDALAGLGLDDLSSGQGSHICLALASQRSAVRAVGWWQCGSASAHDAYHLLCRLMAKPRETTQPDKERNSCLQLTALRLTAFHLPGRLSLAKQWQRAGWLSPETGAAARRGRRQARPGVGVAVVSPPRICRLHDLPSLQQAWRGCGGLFCA